MYFECILVLPLGVWPVLSSLAADTNLSFNPAQSHFSPLLLPKYQILPLHKVKSGIIHALALS